MLNWQNVKTLDWVLIGLWVGGLVLLLTTMDAYPALAITGGAMLILGVVLGIGRVLWAAFTEQPRPEHVAAAEALARETCTTCGSYCDPKKPFASTSLVIDALDDSAFEDVVTWLPLHIFCRASCLKSYLDRLRTIAPSKHAQEEAEMVRAFSRLEMEVR